MGNMLLTPLAEAFEKVRKTEATGVLRIASEGGLRMAFFENGRLVYFASDAPTDSLAAFLSAAGRLDSRAARETLADLHQPRRPLVSLVVDWELCDESRLRPWLIEYAYE